MKNTIFLFLAALLFSATVQAQTTVDSIAAKYKLIPMPEPLTIEKTFPVLGTYQLTMPAAPATTTTTDQTTTDQTGMTPAVSNVTITLDSANKGVVWVEGLPQGKFKAYLKKSPASYRVLAQKTDAGKQIPEGTLVFDPETKTLNIALGKEYDEANPTGIFALNPAVTGTVAPEADATADNTAKVKVKTQTSKSKTKVTFFSATKVEQTTTSSPATAPAPQEQQPTQQ